MHVHGLPTIFGDGFENLDLTVAGNKSAPTAPLNYSYENKCTHEKDRELGCFSGSARKSDILGGNQHMFYVFVVLAQVHL